MHIKNLFFLSIIFLVINLGFTYQSKKRILVFSKTTAHRHSSIPHGKKAIIQLGKENGFEVDTTEDAREFNSQNLKKYSAIVFLITTGDTILNKEQKKAFQEYIRGGGGYVGIHGAADAEYSWDWYGKLVGGRFEGHPPSQMAKVNVVVKDHLATKQLPEVWERFDEWYNYKDLNPDITVILKLDETSYKGGKHDNNHPISWYHKYDGGRSFYTGLGHTDESYTEPLYLKHLLGGIKYAMGENKN